MLPEGVKASDTDPAGSTTQYSYDAFLNPIGVEDASGNTVTFSYDQRGRKIAMADPDRGNWSWSYDTLGEVTIQTDAKAQQTSYSYDVLGRPLSRTEPDLTSAWSYDSAANGIGKLAVATTSGGYSKSISYDSSGRWSASSIVTNSGTAAVAYSAVYNSGTGALSTVYLPDGSNYQPSFSASVGAYQSGVLTTPTTITAANGGGSYRVDTVAGWDAENRATYMTLGNGVVTESWAYNSGSGNSGSGGNDRLASIVDTNTSTNTTLENFNYGYDNVGNVTSWAETVEGLNDTGITYDKLDRLTLLTTASGAVIRSAYDATGNPTSVSGATYSYPKAGGTRPHAVTAITGTTPQGVVNPSFTYDANGNMLTGNGHSMVWTSYNMLASYTGGGKTSSFLYDDRHQRLAKTDVSGGTGTTWYLSELGIGVQKHVAPGTTTWTLYLPGAHGTPLVVTETIPTPVAKTWVAFLGSPGTPFVFTANVAPTASPTASATWLSEDWRGTPRLITSSSGAVLERDASGLWGTPACPGGTPSCANPGQTRLSLSGGDADTDQLVHLGAREYDPGIARWLSPDPVQGAGYPTQGWNPYSYANNNPLRFTDPSGMCILGCFWKPIFHEVGHLFRGIGGLFRDVPVLGDIAVIAASVLACGPAAPIYEAGIEDAALTAAFVAGTASGRLGVALKAGLITYATGEAFMKVGDIALQNNFDATDLGKFEHYTLDGLVGGLSSAAQGGRFQSGFLAAGLSAAATPYLDQGLNPQAIAEHAIVGGLGSILGGGKFENGAVTVAFEYLYNTVFHSFNQFQLGNEAHALFEQYAVTLDPQNVITEATNDGNGNYFFGRVDIANTASQEIWEIKPDNPIGIFAGRVQLEFYSIMSGYSEGGSDFLFPDGPTHTEVGNYGVYTYRYAGDGVVTYQTQFNSQFVFSPVGKKSQGIGILPTTPGIPVFP